MCTGGRLEAVGKLWVDIRDHGVHPRYPSKYSKSLSCINEKHPMHAYIPTNEPGTSCRVSEALHMYSSGESPDDHGSSTFGKGHDGDAGMGDVRVNHRISSMDRH